MNSRLFHFASALCVLFFIISCETKTNRNNILAEVGDLSISVSELEQHYQYNPYLTKIKSNILAKREILAALIAQKLLAQDNQSLSPLDSEYIKQFRREAIIENLWDEKIASHILITESDVFELYRKAKTKKVIRYLVFENEDSAMRASEYINENHSFVKYADLIGMTITDIPRDTIIAGESFEVLEDLVYSKEIGYISDPLKIGHSYFIINITSEISEKFDNESDFQNQYHRLEKILKHRRKQKSFLTFIKEKYPDAPYSLDRKIFKQLALSIEKQIDFSQSSAVDNKLKSLNVDEIDLTNLDHTPVIKFEDGPTWTCRHLLQRLRISPYPVDVRSPESFRKSIIAATKNIMDDEILVAEGKKLGLENSNYVTDQVTMWRDHIKKTDYLISKKINTLKLDSVLVTLADKNRIIIDFNQLKSVTDERTNMTVIKTHFPLRTIVPDLMLTDKLPAFREKIFKIIR
jgi:hypothetical protein